MKLFKQIPLVLALLVSLVTSCENIKDFGDTNVDPNRTTTPNTAALLTNVLSTISNRATQQNPGFFCQYFAETQYPGVSLYTIPQFDFDGVYAGAMYDCQNIINTCNDPLTTASAAVNGSLNNQAAIARILKSYYFWTITDAWGDAPYSQALTGGTVQFPVYDKQEDIYKGILSELTAANAQFDAGNKVKGDIVYNGEPEKWKKFSNSLRMLISLRMSKRYPEAGGFAATEFNAAVKDPAGSIETNADNFTVIYPGGSFRNPWFALYDGRKDVGEATTFITLLTSLSDRRQLTNIYGSSQIGVPVGRNREYMNNQWGGIFSQDQWARVLGASYRAENSGVDVVHAAAVLLARSEAKERGWTSEALDAVDLYRNAITASFTQWGLTVAEATSYYNNAAVFYDGTVSDKINKIALQRYIALYPDGLQGWCEWRRTGVPELSAAQDALNSSGEIPRRFVYGANDYSTNKENVQAAAALLEGGDSQDARIWWDKN
jgi:Starch-binding associating with outer membrane